MKADREDRLDAILETLNESASPDPARKAATRKLLSARAAAANQRHEGGSLRWLPRLGLVGAALAVLVIIGFAAVPQLGLTPARAEAAELRVATINGQGRLRDLDLRDGTNITEMREIRAGDAIRLEPGTVGQLALNDGSTINLAAGTSLTVDALSTKPYRVRLNIEAGRVFSRVETSLGDGEEFAIVTPSSTASVQGTVFETEVVSEQATYYATLEGAVQVHVADQSVVVQANQETLASIDEPLSVHPHGTRLAEELGVPYEEIMGWFDAGFGFGQIKQLYPLSQEAGLTPEEAFDLSESGIPLGIFKQLVSLAAAYDDVTVRDLIALYQSGMNIGQIRQELRRNP